MDNEKNGVLREFYELEQFKSVYNLLNKMRTYLIWFNFLRKNSYKENKSPLQLLNEKENSKINNKIVDFKPRILDYYNSVEIDHDVGGRVFKIIDYYNNANSIVSHWHY